MPLPVAYPKHHTKSVKQAKTGRMSRTHDPGEYTVRCCGEILKVVVYLEKTDLIHPYSGRNVKPECPTCKKDLIHLLDYASGIDAPCSSPA
jgi:hypothetical protein